MSGFASIATIRGKSNHALGPIRQNDQGSPLRTCPIPCETISDFDLSVHEAGNRCNDKAVWPKEQDAGQKATNADGVGNRVERRSRINSERD